MSVTVVSGIREAHPSAEALVESVMAELCADSAELRFGGASGVDTMALQAVCDVPVERVVYVPSVLAAQPGAARKVAQRCATRVVELGLPRGAGWTYLRRNDAMLVGADRLVAFTDGRSSGGTHYTIQAAQRAGLEVVVVGIQSTARENPPLFDVAFVAPVYGVAPYRRDDPVVRAIKRLKAGGAVDPAVMASIVDELADEVERYPALRDADALVPMPRRVPGQPSDLAPIVEALAAATGKIALPDWLVRREGPAGGAFTYHRIRFTPESHAASFEVAGESVRVALVDNVITSGGTMAGAQLAVQRDTGHAPPGLAIRYSDRLAIPF